MLGHKATQIWFDWSRFIANINALTDSLKNLNIKIIMKKIFLLIMFSAFLVNCKSKNEENELYASKIKDINEIVKAIIVQDSLNVSKKGKESKMFCADLVKLNINVPEKRKDGIITIPIPFNSVLLDNLLNRKIKGEVFFSKKDSLTLIEQNSNPNIITIDSEIISEINSTTREKELEKRKKGELYRFYEMNIPIFSLDKNKAYVQLGYHCGGLCGSGKAIYLKKINGKWKIIATWRTWIS